MYPITVASQGSVLYYHDGATGVPATWYSDCPVSHGSSKGLFYVWHGNDIMPEHLPGEGDRCYNGFVNRERAECKYTFTSCWLSQLTRGTDRSVRAYGPDTQGI